MGNIGLTISLVSSATAGGLVAGLLVFLTRTWLAERIKRSIEHEYAQKLETHKAQLRADCDVEVERVRAEYTRQRSLQAVGSSSMIAAQSAAHERRLDALQSLWDGVLRIGSVMPPLLVTADYLTDDEYHLVLTNPTLRAGIEGLTIADLIKSGEEASCGIESVRPFVGEYLYSLYFAYRAVLGRITLSLIRGLEDGKIDHWKRDPGVREILKTVFQADELRELDEMNVGSFLWLQRYFERRIVEDMERVFSGEAAGAFGLKKTEEMLRAASRNVQYASDRQQVRVPRPDEDREPA